MSHTPEKPDKISFDIKNAWLISLPNQKKFSSNSNKKKNENIFNGSLTTKTPNNKMNRWNVEEKKQF